MKVRAGVLGVGSLGQWHVEKYHRSPQAQLVGLYDVNPEAAQRVAAKHKCTAFDSIEALIDEVDAVSIVTPTESHAMLGKMALFAGKHVLIEKPITKTLQQAKELQRLSQERNLKLQVGHLERFNPVYDRISSLSLEPRLIETIRIAPYSYRNTDVDVLMDLMIHDVDLLLQLVRSPVVSMEPIGVKVISDTIDIAKLRLKFANGCLADLSASRLSEQKERKMRIFQKNSVLIGDLLEGTLQIDTPHISEEGRNEVQTHRQKFARVDQIQVEIDLFISSILENTAPFVGGEAAIAALRLVLEAGEKILAAE